MKKIQKKCDKYEKNGIIPLQEGKKTKFYTEYKKTKNRELELSFLPNLYDTIKHNYSITTELYDIVPKYVFDDQQKLRVAGKFLDFLTRKFIFKKKEMSLTITPALVKTNGITKAFYPSTREEIIEDVLRKFATDPNKTELLDDMLSVKFTLYDLWKELRKIRHPYDYGQIKESLQILAKTNLEISSADGKISFSSNMFETLGVVNYNDDDTNTNEEYNKKILYFVRFNSLITKSIKEENWRILNYEQCMSYKKFVSRWLHKRISNMFLNAKPEIPYNILLSTIIRDSGMKKYSLISGNIKQVEDCLKEMTKIGSISKYKIEKIYDSYRTNKIIDAKFLLYIANSFYECIKLNCLTKQDNRKIDENKNNNTIKDFENSEKIKVDNSDSIQLEIKDILTSLNISKKDINKILSSKKNQKNLEQVKNNILAAKSYIEKQKENEEECNNIAVVLASIKFNWNNNKTAKTTEKDKTQDGLQKAKDYIKTIKNKKFRTVSENLLKYFGPGIYIPWLSILKFVAIKDNALILSCENGFAIDEVKRQYLNGVYRTEPDGSITWLRKGIKEIVEETEPEIKKIEIIKLSN